MPLGSDEDAQAPDAARRSREARGRAHHHGVKPNKIVRYMLDAGRRGERFDLNKIGIMYGGGLFSRGDIEQFYQLIGYSIDGFAELSFIRESSKQKAEEKSMRLMAESIDPYNNANEGAHAHAGGPDPHCPEYIDRDLVGTDDGEDE